MRSIAAKFLVPVAGLAIVLSLLNAYLDFTKTREANENLLEQQASLALAFDLAIRGYVVEEIRPRMRQCIGYDAFNPETMSSSFVARRVFEKVRKQFPDYIIKFSSDNPRNPANQAGSAELRMIKYFNDNPQVSEWAGEIEMDGRPYLAHFSTRRMAGECLQCHGEPGDAPASLLKRYGTKAGFHRPLGQVIALDTVAIPLEKAHAAMIVYAIRHSALIMLGFLTLMATIALVFWRVVTRRLAAMAAHFQRIANNPDSAPISCVEVKGDDEIGVLARSFNALADRISAGHASLERRVSERTSELEGANHDLQREVVERKQAEAQLEVRARQQAAVADFGRSALSGGDLPDLFDGAVMLVADILNADCAAILEHVPDKHHLLLRAGWGWGGDHVGSATTSDSADSHCGYTLKCVAPVIMSDIHTERRFRPSELLTSKGVVSGMSVAIPDVDRPFGVLTVHTCRERSFTQDDAHFLRSIANVLAEAIARKRTEKQLVQAQKMESIGALAAGIAHEINTPTQYVGDNTRFLRDGVNDLLKALDACLEVTKADATPQSWKSRVGKLEATLRELDLEFLREEIPKAIEQSLEGLERVTKIVRAMKDFSHPDREEKQPVDLNKAIESTITVARNEWKYVAEMKTDLDPSLPLVCCRVGDFNQVILNIIVNAAHAIADVVGQGGTDKGTITVSTRRDGECVEIRISDTGTGIPEQYRPNIFDHFFTTKEVGKGTGQGLSLAYSIVTEKHGGTISFETEMGRGTTFVIRLPIESGPKELMGVKSGEKAHSLCR